MPRKTGQKRPIRAIRIEDRLWQAAQNEAARRGETVSEVVRRALIRYVPKGAMDDTAPQAASADGGTSGT